MVRFEFLVILKLTLKESLCERYTICHFRATCDAHGSEGFVDAISADEIPESRLKESNILC